MEPERRAVRLGVQKLAENCRIILHGPLISMIVLSGDGANRKPKPPSCKHVLRFLFFNEEVVQ